MFKRLPIFIWDLSREGSPKSRFYQYPLPKFFSRVTTLKKPEFCLTEFLRESCGIPPERTPAVSRALGGKTLRRPDSLLAFLRNEGFSKTQIAELVSKIPKLLQSRVESTLKPKFEFLREKGLSQSEVADVLSSNPWILLIHLDNSIRPLYDVFLPFVGSYMTAREAFESLSILTLNWKKTFVPNVTLLRAHGVPNLWISKLLRKHPRTMMCNTTRFSEKLKFIVELGFKPSTASFMHAVRVLCSMNSSTLEAKLKIFKSFGWSKEDVFSAFRRTPVSLAFSGGKLSSNLDFFSKELGWGESIITVYPYLLAFSVEKRLVPRLKVLEGLESKKLIKDIKVVNPFMMTDAEFRKKYVVKYQDKFPGVLEIYSSASGLKEN